MREVIERFGKQTRRRIALASRLERIYRVAIDTGSLNRFVIFGSFVSAEPEPNDVDVFLLMDGEFDSSKLHGIARLLFEHSSAETFFGASVFWLRRYAALGGEQAAMESWQVKRNGEKRGIVEIVGEGP